MKYTTLIHSEDLEALGERLRQLPPGSDIGLDFEYWSDRRVGDDLDFTSLYLVGYALYDASSDEAWYIPMRHSTGEPNARVEAAKDLLREVVLQTGSFFGHRVWFWSGGDAELHLLTLEGVGYGQDSSGWYDGMLAAWLAGWGTDKALKLKKLASERLQEVFPDFKQVAAGRDCHAVPVTELGPYCAKDAMLCVKLGVAAYKELEAFDAAKGTGLVKHFHEVDMPCLEVLRSMRHVGLAIHTTELDVLKARLTEEADAIWWKFYTLTQTVLELKYREDVPTGEKYKNGKAKTKKGDVSRWAVFGADVGSDREVAVWCYEVLKVWPMEGLKRNGHGNYPIDRETIEQYIPLGGLAQELVELRLAFNMRDKLLSTYVGPLAIVPELSSDGRVHPRQSVTGTDTQRFAHSQPNFANLPSRTDDGKLVRAAIHGGEGYEVTVCDMSQAELRVAAHLTKDPELMWAYMMGEDVHVGTLDKLLEYWPEATRTDAKIVNFSSLYGITGETLAIKAKTSVANGEAMLQAFNARFVGYNEGVDRMCRFVAKHGYMKTLDGFCRPLDNEMRRHWKTGKKDLSPYVRRATPNTAIQGTVAGILKMVIVRVHKKWLAKGWVQDAKAQMLMTEHDAILFRSLPAYTEEAALDIMTEIENAIPMSVPFKADRKTGRNWKECK